MGRAARANPRSFAGGKPREDVGQARLQHYAKVIKTPRELEVFLKRFRNEDDRERMRVALREHCEFDPEAIKREDELFNRLTREKAAYGKRPIYNKPID